MREHAALEKLEHNHNLIMALEEARRLPGSHKRLNKIDSLLHDVDAAGWEGEGEETHWSPTLPRLGPQPKPCRHSWTTTPLSRPSTSRMRPSSLW